MVSEDGEGNFSGVREWAPPIDPSLENWLTLGFLDYDGDGYLDILGSLGTNYDTTQSICLVRGLEGATFEDGFTKILVSEYDPQTEEGELRRLRVALQDFDGDGRKDIIFQNHIVFLGVEPLIATETNVDLSRSINGWDEDLPLIDWNQDGMPDLIGLSRAQELTVRVNEGHGNFSEMQIFEIPLLETVSSPYMDIYPIRSTGNKDSLELCLIYEVDDVDHFSILTRTADGSLRVSVKQPRTNFHLRTSPDHGLGESQANEFSSPPSTREMSLRWTLTNSSGMALNFPPNLL